MVIYFILNQRKVFQLSNWPVLTVISRYTSEFCKTALLARKLSYQCARKITHLVLETEAFMSAQNPPHENGNLSSPSKTPTIPGSEYRRIIYAYFVNI